MTAISTKLFPNVFKLKIVTESQTMLSNFFFDLVWVALNVSDDICYISYYCLIIYILQLFCMKTYGKNHIEIVVIYYLRRKSLGSSHEL